MDNPIADFTAATVITNTAIIDLRKLSAKRIQLESSKKLRDAKFP